MIARDLREDAVVAEQRHDHELGEQTRFASSPAGPLRPQSHRSRPAELDADHEAAAANLVHDLVPFGRHRVQPAISALAGGGRALDDRLRIDGVQRREPGRHREHVLAEGRAVHDGAVHLVEHRLDHDLPLRDHRADRHVAAGQRLGHGDQIGLDLPLLEREERAGAPEPGLHLVDGEQRAVTGDTDRRPRAR